MISIVTHSEMDPLVVLDPVDNWIVSAEVDCQCSWTLEEFGTKCNVCQANDESEASDDDSSEEESEDEDEENKKPRASASGGGAASKRRRKE